MHDFTYPSNRLFSLVWNFYFKLLQTTGAWKYPQWKTVFDGLPDLLRETTWTDELERSLRENGFSETTLEYLTLGTSAIVTAKKAQVTAMC